MKKLMIAACAVAFAAAAQAAQYQWSGSDTSSGYLAGNEGDAVVGTAYLFYSGSADYTIAQLRAAIEGGTFLSGGWDKLALDSTAIGGTTGAFNGESPTGLAGATGDSFYVVALATASEIYEDGTSLGPVDPAMAYLSDAVTPATVETLGATMMSFDMYGDGTGTSSAVGSNWYAQPVPEPTSGLILLLGVAGLALKRRRA